MSFLVRPATLLKKRLRHRCFPVNCAKKFKNTFFIEHLRATASEDKKENTCMRRCCNVVDFVN